MQQELAISLKSKRNRDNPAGTSWNTPLGFVLRVIIVCYFTKTLRDLLLNCK